MTDKKVATDVIYNGLWYQVSTPSGDSWTFDEEDKDIAYIESALYAWSRWLDYVRSEQNGVA